MYKILLSILLTVSCQYNYSGEVYTSTTTKELKYRRFFMCGRQFPSLPWIATGQHQVIRVVVGGSEITYEGVNVDCNHININGEIHEFNEQGIVH